MVWSRCRLDVLCLQLKGNSKAHRTESDKADTQEEVVGRCLVGKRASGVRFDIREMPTSQMVRMELMKWSGSSPTQRSRG